MLDGQVERRMCSAVLSVGSFWYTAWLDAGSPDLSKFVNNTQDAVKDSLNESPLEGVNDVIKARDHE